MKIQIYDQSYNVNADGNEEYLHELAAYVDGKMRSIAESTHMVDSLKVAVLAALNIADEYHLLKRKQESGATDYQKRAHLLADALDEVLEEKRKAG